MFLNFSKCFFVFLLLIVSAGFANAQMDSKDYPDSIKENLAKRRIKEEEKEFNELVKRGEEALKISEELNESFEENNKLSSEDQKKLEKLEKVVKRIRKDLGASDDKDEEQDDSPSTLSNTIKAIKEKTSNLLTELKKTSRYSISVVAVESSNAIFKLVRLLRFNKN